MIKQTRIISANLNAQMRELTHNPYKGVTNVNEILSGFGVDANPYPRIMAAHAPATTNARGAIIGFYNKYNASQPGERRTYSTNPDGSEQVTDIYQLNDGSLLIRAGIAGGDEKYSMLIDPDGNIAESFGTKTLTGDIVLKGNLTVEGDIVGDTVKDKNGIDLGTHVHGYLDNGVPLITDPPS